MCQARSLLARDCADEDPGQIPEHSVSVTMVFLRLR
jgi:hypothetical protein